MAYEDIGSIGGLEVRLAQVVPADDRYRRNYVPVTPKSQEIIGADAKIAPESTVATWSLDDWSAGEGDLRWRDVGRYNLSSQVGPAWDGNGIVVGPKVVDTTISGATFHLGGNAFCIDTGNVLYTARDSGDDLYSWDTVAEEWVSFRTLGGAGTNDVVSMAAASSGTVFVNDGTNVLKLTAGSNATHYAAYAPQLVAFGGSLYGIGGDGTNGTHLYEIDQATATTRTSEYDNGSQAAIAGLPSINDVGPIWTDLNGYLYEYNVATDTGSIVAVLPREGHYSFSGPVYVRNTYFVGYSTGAHRYIWYKSPVGEGVIGPLDRNNNGERPLFNGPRAVGSYGDRVMFTWDGGLWAYDMSSGAVLHLRDSITSTSDAILYRNSAFLKSLTATFQVHRVTFTEASTTAGWLRTGRYDYGYLGLNKVLTKVTVTAEQQLGTGDIVNLEYSTDGSTFTAIPGAMVAGEASKTWAVSTSSGTASGVDFEFRVSLTAGSEDSDLKVVSIVSEAIGAESRIEWVVAIDVSTNNLQDGQSILEGLKALKTSPAVIELVDPWQQLDFEQPEQFDVTVEELSTPFEHPGGQRYAIVKLRASETVGLTDPVTAAVVTPSTIATTVTVPTPSIVAGNLATPSSIAATVSIGTPTVSTSGAVSEFPVTYLTTNTTLSTEGIYIVDTDSANIVITLPALSSIGTDGLEFIVIRDGTNYVYVVPYGSDEYWDTTVQKTIFDDFGAVGVVAHDTDDEWHELGRFRTVT